ncbi:MAG: 30S ribosomal protein S6 [Parcubacteria group bacterium Athens0714_26]|nr:MAG: 30S ribosomal protein S6 [Parcubacteria group bacterium Athens1014_26]TSD02671.1 MAG: 30S ribosomal protein S6 [Parcubacteria group bacterium Athens0714_26]
MSKKKIDNLTPQLYEIAFILMDPSESVAIINLLSQYKATIVHKAEPVDIRLSYPIKKHSAAYFGYIQFKVNAEDIIKIKESLKLNQSILRFLIINLLSKKEQPERRIESKNSFRPENPVQTVLTNEALEERLEEILK